MEKFRHTERIEAYLEGQMDKERRARFEMELERDASLKAEFDAFVAAEQAVERMAFNEMLGRVKDKPPTGKADKKKWTRWMLPLAVAGLAVLAWLLFFQKNSNESAPLPARSAQEDTLKVEKQPMEMQTDDVPKKEDKASAPPTKTLKENSPARPIALADSLYEKVGFSGQWRGANGAAKDALSLAAAAFDSSDFKKALALATAFKKNDPQYLQALEIRSHAAFRLRDYGSAVEGFREQLTALDGDAGKRTEGYLLFALLADGRADTEEFKRLLEKIRGDVWHPFHEVAVGILAH